MTWRRRASGVRGSVQTSAPGRHPRASDRDPVVADLPRRSTLFRWRQGSTQPNRPQGERHETDQSDRTRHQAASVGRGHDAGHRAERYDSADVLRLEQVTRPAIADNEVLLRVRAAGLSGTGTDDWSPFYFDSLSGFAGPRTRCPQRCRRDGCRYRSVKRCTGSLPARLVRRVRGAREDKRARKPATFVRAGRLVPVSAMTALQQSEGPGEPGGRSA